MTSAPRVAIILVNWNGRKDTLACLESLSADKYPNKEIVLVDNGSNDDSVSAIRNQYPDTTILENGANLGFTGGNNRGINFALEQGADYVLLLNNDTTVEPHALTELVAAAEADRFCGILTPVIHYFDHKDEVWFAGSAMDLSRGTAVHDNSHVPARVELPRQIPWASGCAMLMPRRVLESVGGLDDRYFIYWEDVDFNLRVRAIGYKVSLVPASRIYHKVSRSPIGNSASGRYYYVRNNLLMIKTHATGYRVGMWRVIIERMRESLRAIKNRNVTPGVSLCATLRAIRDHLVGRYGKYDSSLGQLTPASGGRELIHD